MSRQIQRLTIVGAVLLGLAVTASAREKPAVHTPRNAQTKQDLDRREAMRLFALGAIQERSNRLVQAIKSYEAARKLDPESVTILRTLAPIYFALDRSDDGMAACKEVLRIDPDDYQTAGLYARQLRTNAMHTQAIEVLTQATKSKRLKERPDIATQVWTDLGQLQHTSGKLKEAISSFRRVAELFSNPIPLLELTHLTREEIAEQCAESYEKIGRLCLEASDPTGAAAAFEQAQKKDSSRAARLSMNLAQVYVSQKKYKEALAQVETYLQSLPQGTEGYELKINAMRKLGQETDIISWLEQAAERDHHNLALNLLLAREYRSAKKSAPAEKLYIRMLEKHATMEVYKGLFDLHRSQGKIGASKVLERFNSAVQKGIPADQNAQANATEAGHARAMVAVLKDDKELVARILEIAVNRLAEDERQAGNLAYATRGFLATLAARTKQLSYAERLYRSCLSKPGGPGDGEADVYSGLLRVLRAQYKHEEVVKLCNDALPKAQATSRLLFHTELGRACQMLGRDQEAIKALALAVDEANKDQRLYCKRLYIDALVTAGKTETALTECQALLKEYNQGGQLREVRMQLANVYQAQDKHELADKQHKLVLEEDPNDATANNNLGYTWAERNMNLDEAERHIRKAIELERQQRNGNAAEEDEDSAAYIDSLGWVLFRRGKYTEARSELEKAVKLPGGDDDPTVWDHLGDVYWRLGQKEKAVDSWKAAISLYDKRTRRPQPERVKEIHEKIKAAKAG